LYVLGSSIGYYETCSSRAFSLLHTIKLSFLLDNAVKGLEESQLARESIGYETADEREIAYNLDFASNADEDGGSSIGAKGEALSSASLSLLLLHSSSHTLFSLGCNSPSSAANAAQLTTLGDSEANRHVTFFLTL